MTTVTTTNSDIPALAEQSLLTPAQLGEALTLLGLPDVSGLALPADYQPQAYAELANDLEERLLHAARVYSEIVKPLIEMQRFAMAQVEKAIIDAGGRALPHESLEITLDQKEVRQRDVAVLRQKLAGRVPDAEFRKAVFIKSVDTKGADPAAIQNVIENGGEPVWDCDLRVLDKMARDYGGDIAGIIAESTGKVAVGKPMLTIRRREPAMKLVGGAR